MRTKNEESSLTYKKDHFENDGKWLYSDEYEIAIDSYEMGKKIIEILGLKRLLTINNLKKLYKFKEYEITLEKVEDLGLFLEVEYYIYNRLPGSGKITLASIIAISKS
ncbi:MAG: CYTH domain-containing protein [Bacilli bacterium]|nr:CYTH domain-containing protein [Bacilli bacterium]